MEQQQKPTVLEDDTKEPMTLMVEHRFPWLAIGLAGGIGLTLLASNFEELLSRNIALSFLFRLLSIWPVRLVSKLKLFI